MATDPVTPSQESETVAAFGIITRNSVHCRIVPVLLFLIKAYVAIADDPTPARN